MPERTQRYQTFVRLVLEKLDSPTFANTMTPEQRVGGVIRLTDAMIEMEDGMDLSDANATVVAAVIAVAHQADAQLGRADG